ncbi:MAG: hypothetical protein J6D14_04365 [Lachnospiraceae bacterium]|nr:hypothetical protein [Lachnospiraceae bacterium]
MVVLYFVGKRLQKKQEAQQQQIEAQKQVVNLLIIDKKRLPIKDSGLPQQVIDQVPKLMRRNKMPVVKVKAGPRIMTMIADEKIFDALPVKKEVKATVSGIYIIDVKALHGKVEAAPPKKKTLRTKLLEKRDSLMKKTTSSK